MNRGYSSVVHKFVMVPVSNKKDDYCYEIFNNNQFK